MEEAGIDRAESLEGIKFCVSSCPYSRCVVFEKVNARILRSHEREEIAKGLKAMKVSVDDIALILGVERRTVFKLLEKRSI